MAGTSYSRTSGHAILPGTWQYIRHRGDIADFEKLDPERRYDYDTAGSDKKSTFMRLAQEALTTPPNFLVFALADSKDQLSSYPGAVDATLGKPANGSLQGITHELAATNLGISQQQLSVELAKFTGHVTLGKLLAGQKIYRSVGLTATTVGYGSVTNMLLGKYWEPICPSQYASEAQWRAATAVKAEWNGDHGYIEVQLNQEVYALIGKVGMQKLDRQSNEVLPGGGDQFYIPALNDNHLMQPIMSSPLIDVIKPTNFGSVGDVA